MEHQIEIHDGYGVEEQTERVLKGLGFEPVDFEKSMKTLSGGWQMRVELAKILLAKPDLVLLDVQLADRVSGLDVLNSLRQQPNLQDLPIVMMTPMGTGERDRFLEVGANDCLNKPIGIFQLESILMKYLN